MRLVQTKSPYDLLVTRGRSDPSVIPITDEPSTEMRLVIKTDPKLSWIAIEDGRPIGFSVGFVRGALWFLSDLFVLPGSHGKGVGAELQNRWRSTVVRAARQMRKQRGSSYALLQACVPGGLHHQYFRV